jgi:hypothetical protein
MWIRVIGNTRYGYDTYLDCVNDTNRYLVYIDGIFFKRIE